MKNGTVVLSGVALFSGLFLLFSTGCYYDNEEDLYPDTTCDTSDVRYSNTIQPLLAQQCMSCHSNSQAPVAGNGISFEGYTNLKNYLDVAEEYFLGSIHREPGFPQMPKGGAKLKDCDIRKIEIWIADGKQNN